MALIQHPKLANSKLFNLVNPDSKFSFMLEIRDIYIKHPNSAASIILEKIDQEKIIMERVNLADSGSFYTKFGDIFALLCFLITSIFTLYSCKERFL